MIEELKEIYNDLKSSLKLPFFLLVIIPFLIVEMITYLFGKLIFKQK